MTVRLRMALAAAFATALTATSLIPLVHPARWIAEGLVVVLITGVVGEVARRLGVVRPLVGVVQLVVVFWFLLALLVPDASGIPTPGAVREFGDLLNAGGNDIRNYTTPAPATDGISAIVLTVTGAVAVLVDVVAVTYGQAAAAGLPLLALYSVPAALAKGKLGWWVFLLAGAGYVVLLLAEGHERLLRWGRPLDAVPGRRRGSPRGSVGIGVATLAVALLVPLIIPLGSNRLAGGQNSGNHITTINPVVSLKNQLNQNENTQLLRYTTDAANPDGMYLRLSSLSSFDGTSWAPGSDQKLTDVPRVLPRPKGLDESVATTRVTTDVTSLNGYVQSSLPMPYAASEVKVKGSWRYEDEGRLLLGDKGQTTKNLKWQVVSLDIEPTAAQLEAAARPPADLAPYLQLPNDVRAEMEPWAAKFDGYGTDYEKAKRLEDWFATSGAFTYDTHVPAGTGTDALENFLRQKVGYCEQFSSAMAVLARVLGIPSRVAVGFVPGTRQSDGSYVVGSHDAHAWPELYFQGAGWVRFEPTPSRGSAPSWTTSAPTVTAPVAAPTATAPADVPSVAPTASATCPGGVCTSQSAAPAATHHKGHHSSHLWRWVVVGVVAAMLLLALLALPMLLRLRTRRRRLGALSHDASLAGASPGSVSTGNAVVDGWQEVLDTARDLGWPGSPSETPRQTAVRLGGLLADDDGETQAALVRLAGHAERSLYGPAPDVRPRGLAQDVTAACAALSGAADRWTRARARWLPASTLRRERRPLRERLPLRRPRPRPAE